MEKYPMRYPIHGRDPNEIPEIRELLGDRPYHERNIAMIYKNYGRDDQGVFDDADNPLNQ